MPRTHTLDNVRTALTVLVVLHHTALAYGGIGAWRYVSRFPQHAPATSAPLVAFNVLNQTFFMATFFLLSGYFSALTAGRKPRRTWLREKWKRLAVPTAAYSVFGPGVADAIIRCVRDGAGWDAVPKTLWEGIKSCRGVRGAVWYTGLLFLFDVTYAVLRRRDFALDSSTSDSTPRPGPEPRPGPAPAPAPAHTPAHTPGPAPGDSKPEPRSIPLSHVLLALLTTSMSAFLLRIPVPLSRPFVPLNLNVGYLPQYVLFYTTGVLAHTRFHAPLPSLLASRTQSCLGIVSLALAAAGLASVVSELRKPGRGVETVVRDMTGSFTRIALAYALLNEFLGAFLAALILGATSSASWFGSLWARKWTVAGLHVARYSYAAFLVHIPVLVFLQSLADAWDASGVVKTVALGCPGVVASWVVGWAMVRLVEGCGFRGYI